MSTTAAVPPNLETMPLEELRRLTTEALNQPLTQEVAPPVTQTTTEVTPPATEDTKPKRFRREIDLGDGSGVQKFEGATLDELVEKLVEAQRHATRKIREQETRLKANEKPAAPLKPVSAEERLAAIESQIAWANTAAEFVGAHPEYQNTQQNAVKMERYMAAQGIPRTFEGLEQAFKELSESGLLVGKNATTAAPETTERIVPPATTTAPSSSGLSARAGSLAHRAAKEEITVEDLQKMSLAELRQKTKEVLGS